MHNPRARLRFWLLTIFIIGLGAMLHRDAVNAPLVADDLAQRAMLDNEFPSSRSMLDLYSFADGTPSDHQRQLDAGTLPWWAAPRVRFAFMRPLSSALVAMDHRLFGNRAVPPHVHSLLWFAALLASVAALVDSLFGGRIALLATLFFAVDESLIWGIAWAANRHALISVTFAVLALRYYIRVREHPMPRTRDVAMAVALFVLSLAAGEVGVCMLAYPAGYEAFTARGALLKRIRASWPWLLPFSVFTVAYLAFHRGSSGSDVYVDPLSQPRAYARLAPPRYAALLADLVFARPFNTTPPDPILLGELAIALVIVAMIVHRARQRLNHYSQHQVLWLAWGALVAMAPSFGSIVTERLALPSELGLSVIAAVLASDGISAIAGRWHFTRSMLPRLGRAAFAALVIVTHVGVAARRTRGGSTAWAGYSSAVERTVAASDLAHGPLADATIVMLTAVEPSTLIYVPRMWHLHGAELPREFRVLAYTRSDLFVRRVAPNILDVYMVDDVWMTNGGETLYRTLALPFRAGDVVTMRGLDVTILVMGQVGPRLVRFQFDRSLDDPKLILCISTAFGIVRVPPPLIGADGYVPPPQLPVFAPLAP